MSWKIKSKSKLEQRYRKYSQYGRLNIFEQKDLKEKFRNVAGSEDKIKKIDEDIKRLETLYSQVKSSKAPEFEDYTGAK